MALRALPSSAAGDRRVRSTPKTSEVGADPTSCVVVLHDEPDLSARSDLSEVLARLIACGTGDVVVDLAHADFIDTPSFFTLAAAARLLDSKGRQLIFRSPSKLATRVLNLFGLSDRIDPSGEADQVGRSSPETDGRGKPAPPTGLR